MTRSTGSCRQTFATVLRCAALFALVVTLVPQVGAEPRSAVPEHARAVDYGIGWLCLHGFHEERGACAALQVPENAYVTPLGNGWECNRLYRKVDGACVALVIPPHAFAEDSPYGRGWSCEQGYRESAAACVAVRVPPNAYALGLVVWLRLEVRARLSRERRRMQGSGRARRCNARIVRRPLDLPPRLREERGCVRAPHHPGQRISRYDRSGVALRTRLSPRGRGMRAARGSLERASRILRQPVGMPRRVSQGSKPVRARHPRRANFALKGGANEARVPLAPSRRRTLPGD